MKYILVVALGYLLGCSNMAKYIAAMKKVDLSAGGSGNPGASNAVILMGWGAGVLVAIHDIGKAALAVILARLMFPGAPLIGAAAGVAAVLGHIYPFWMKFKGGKGFASYLGMTIALNWKFAIVVLLLVAVVTLITDYIVADHQYHHPGSHLDGTQCRLLGAVPDPAAGLPGHRLEA